MSLKWFPPAETDLPWSLLFRVLFPSGDNPLENLYSLLGVRPIVFLGCSGRALLFELLTNLKALHSNKKNEVVIPGYTCYSVAAAVARAGLKIKVYDLDPSNFHPDPVSLKKSVSDKTLCIFSQHLFGIPTPVGIISETAKSVGAYHIEDAAQALGGLLNEKPLGTLGDFGLLSFGRGKPLSIYGGGALIQNIALNSFGINRSKSPKGFKTFFSSIAGKIIGNPVLYGIAENIPLGLGKTVFERNFGVTDMSVVSKRFLFHSKHLLFDLNAHRRMIAGIYTKAFKDFGTIPLEGNSLPVYSRFPLLVKDGCAFENIRKFGIRRMYPDAISDEKSISPFLSGTGNQTPGAAEISKRLITLPTNTHISEKTAHNIACSLLDSLNS